MNLIRNGGFESGDESYWECSSGGSIGVGAAYKKYGVFGCRLTSSGAVYEVALNRDYITVSPYQLYNVSVWMKQSVVRDYGFIVYYYDSDYSLIGSDKSPTRGGDTAYKQYYTQVDIPAEVQYIQLGVYIEASNNGETFDLDNVSINLTIHDNIGYGAVSLGLITGVSSSGSTTGTFFRMLQFREYYADLYCHALSGTDETLDVDVVEIRPDGQDEVVGSFAQLLATGKERITLSEATGRDLHVDYTIGGTSVSASFIVYVIGKV